MLGYDATAAGAAMLPTILLITLLSPTRGRAGARGSARGCPMTVGPLIVAAGTLLLVGVDGSSPYVVEILPGSLLQGLGMALTVAPLTATVLGAAPDELAGIASGVNNAVARAAQLLAVAALPGRGGALRRRLREPVALHRRVPRGDGDLRRCCSPPGGAVSWCDDPERRPARLIPLGGTVRAHNVASIW